MDRIFENKETHSVYSTSIPVRQGIEGETQKKPATKKKGMSLDRSQGENIIRTGITTTSPDPYCFFSVHIGG